MKNSIKRAQSKNRFSALSDGRILSEAKTKYLALAALAILWTGCTNEEEPAMQEDTPKGTPITIASAGVAGAATRAIETGSDDTTGTLTGTNASIGLYANMAVTDIDSEYQADHERFDYSSDKWEFNATDTKDATQMLYNGEFTWIAYSPYSIKTTTGEDCLHDNGTFSVPTDGDYTGGRTDTNDTYCGITSVSGSQYDLLWGTGTAGSEKVDLTLNHVLAMLVVKINETFGTEITDNPTIESLTIGGTVVTGTLDLTNATASTGVVTVQEGDGVTATDITAATFSANRYEALIIPQTATLTITVTLSNGNTYSATLSKATTFVSGNKYTLSLKVGKDKVELTEVTATENIPGWDEDSETDLN